MNAVLTCKDVKKQYPGSPILALDGVDFNIERGQIVGLLGPNGSGKTTLIKLICGLLVPTSGSVEVSGVKPGAEANAKISYLPDKDYLPDWMNVSELLDYFKDFYSDFDYAKASEMIRLLGITPIMRLKTMSKGTREKMQLALVMSRAADLYILDEPIAGVDPAARDFILDTIISGYNENSAVVISTHLIVDVEKVLDKVVFINKGVVTLSSSVDEIREQHGKSVDSFFREVYKC